MSNLKLTIRTPEKTIFAGEAKHTKLFTEQGILKVLPHHASLMGTIDFSPLVFVDEMGKEYDYVIKKGVLLVSNAHNSVDIMVFGCELKAELSPTTATEYLKFIEAELKKGTDLSQFRIRFYEEEKYVIEKQLDFLQK